MFAKVNRILAFVYAIGLGIGETVMNWGHWQYAPLWIVDYLIVVALLFGAIKHDPGKSASILKAAWAFAFGVMYMALFISLEPELAALFETPPTVLLLMGLLNVLALIGFALAVLSKGRS